MESIFDLPTHALTLHAPIVLQPLVALATIIVVSRQPWRDRFTPWLAGALAIVIVATLVAINSGEAFDELLGGQVDVSKHESLALTTRNLMIGWFVALLGLAGAQRRKAAAHDSPVVRFGVPAFALVAVVLAVATTVWMVRTGHEGSRVVWSGVVEANRD